MCMLGLSDYYLNSIHYRDSLRLFMNKVCSRLPDYLNNKNYPILQNQNIYYVFSSFSRDIYELGLGNHDNCIILVP